MSSKTPRVGITGGIGSGKSTVCRIFETAFGIPVFDADQWAKRLILEDPALRKGILELFGPEAYTKEGAYDRVFVAKIVFGDPDKLAALNALVHPAVERASRQWHQEKAELGVPYTLKEAALLIESGGHRFVDYLIVVSAPEALRIQRVMQRDQLTEKQVRARIRGQMPEAEKLKLADFVLLNDGEQMLLPQIWKIHQELIRSQN